MYVLNLQSVRAKSYTLYAKEPPAPRKYGAINTEEETDLQGAFSGSDLVFRGGSWDNVSDDCAVSYRHGGNPNGRSYYLDFRVVRASSK